jgi:hypothetical protein
MTTKIIQREFVAQNSYGALPSVSLDVWSSFMNTYAVWPENSNSVTIRRDIELQKGYYYVTGAVDNSGTVIINGTTINLYNFDVGISRTTIGNNTRVYHPGGKMSVVINATNFGGPRGVAVTISKELRNDIGGAMAGRLAYVYSVGDLVWDTRSGIAPSGRFVVTMPFKAEITAHAWGGGGGGGGMDAGTFGGLGAPGLYNTTTFTVNKGDLLEVFVGAGGDGGTSNRGSAPGGPGGESRININGDSTKSFNGGTGTAAGPTPYSGGGGGGGGASGVLVNNNLTLVAGGGAGGGGGGNDGNAADKYARRDASINNNAMNNNGITVQSTNFNVTRVGGTAFTSINGSEVSPRTTRGHQLAVINPTTFALESVQQFDTYGTGNSTALVNALNAVGNGKIVAISSYDAITLDSNLRNLLNSQFGGTQTATTIRTRTSHVFISKKNVGFSAIEILSTTSTIVGFLGVNVPYTDYRGENGAPKGGDGGGAGGGGGGYPGGQGGLVAPGDSSGFAGKCGGNFPVRSATTGTNTAYYKPGYSGGGERGSGNGQSGRVFLLIKPIGKNSVKVAGQWKQVEEAFVKIDNNWKDVDTIYVKVDNKWRVVEGSGGNDIDLASTSGNYGTSNRPYA